MQIPGRQMVREQLARTPLSRARLGIRRRDLVDRVIASDPGLTHLRLGIKVATCIASTLLLQWLLATALGQPPVLAMLLGAVVAMLLSSGVRENTRRRTILTALPGLPAALVGASLATLTAPWHTAELVLFVGVSFVAVWVRRFGGAWLSYGMLCWQSFFFILFLDPPVSALPDILLVITASVAWVSLLLCTVLYEDPASRLLSTVNAFRARCRSAIAELISVLDAADDEHPSDPARRLRSQLVQLGEIALLIDGQLSETRALPEGVSPTRVRQWVIDLEIATDDLIRGVTAPAVEGLQLSESQELRRMLESLGWAEYDLAASEVAALLDSERPAALPRVGRAADRLLRLSQQWRSGEVLTAGTDDAAEDSEDYESVVTLRAGRLPGTAQLAEEALADRLAERAGGPRSLRRRASDAILALPLTTRQAIQAALAAALAILVGHLISPQRYYWAVIAAFISFTNAATASETLRRSIARVLGTTAGLVIAVALANVTAGNVPLAFAVLLGALALAWYFFSFSYAGMVLMITVALGQLYGLLRTFSDEVLVLRLEETIAGAVIGAVVGLAVLPTSTLDTVRTARRTLLDTAADLLDSAAGVLRTGGDDPGLLTSAIRLDDAARQLEALAESLVHARFFGSRRQGLRHRVAVIGSIAATCRKIAVTAAHEPADTGDDARSTGAHEQLAQICELLATDCRRLAGAENLINTEDGSSDLGDRVGDLLEQVHYPEQARPAGPVSPVGLQLGRLADALSLLSPRGR